ncbi:PEPxxWA-CTERM sorting domain-containing protein (plasmid) [Polymorphobacter megasporae]|nr:PEPxxWA-CTERM sorting domain-containing protein [Polymorphobacter megasporae]UAJ12639.1 PEPxxWA-CTERM sorting domain-containing protein [Polymorphobacter megasporae]
MSAAAGAVVVDINALTNTTPATSGVPEMFAAGTYRVNPIIGTYTAFSRFASTSGCDEGGFNCSQGYEHSYVITIDGVSTGYGDGNANGGIGPISPGNGYYDTAAKAFAYGATKSSFTLSKASAVNFSIFDDYLPDNRGGISLDVTAVPEPATWAMLIFGFSLTGFAARRRRTAGTIVAA